MLSYNSKLRIGFLAAGLLSFIIGFVSWSSNRNLAESKDWESHTFAVISRIESFSLIIKDSELHFLNFIFTGDKFHVQDYESSRRDLFWNLEDLKSLTGDNEMQQAALKDLEENLKQRDQFIRNVMIDRANPSRAKSVITSMEENIRSLIESLKKRENDLLVKRAEDSRTKIIISEWVVSISILFNVLLLIVWYRFLDESWKQRLIAEKALFEKNTLLELILSSMADGVIVLDSKGNSILLNEKAEALIKKSPELFSHLKESGEDKGKFGIHINPNEESIILASPMNLAGSDGKKFGKMFLLSDITKEENIALEKEKFLTEMLMIKTALDCASSSIMIADNDLNVVYTNQAVVSMFRAVNDNIREDYPNFSPEKLLGACIDTFHSKPEKQRQILSTFTSTHRSSIQIGGRQFNLNAAPVINKDNERLGSVVEWLDVTDRNQKQMAIITLNSELEDSVRKLEYANRELEAFSYSVSHDLRAPIRGVDGFTRILLEDHSSTLDKEGLRILNVIADNSKFMGQLIDDLLAFYRVSKVEPKRERIDMKHMVLDVIEIVTQDYSKSSVLAEVGELPLIIGDPPMIKQVWLNLISNSFKYSSKISKPKIEVGVIDGESEKTFYVKDNGAGFNDQYSHKLFKVFQRLHSNEEFYGTGIGLAIVDRIVGRHGGRVWGTGKVGEGATFYFTLPKKD